MNDGAIIVKNIGAFTVPDGTGGAAKPILALCRCGPSANKPFCDGTHKKVGWSE